MFLQGVMTNDDSTFMCPVCSKLVSPTALVYINKLEFPFSEIQCLRQCIFRNLPSAPSGFLTDYMMCFWFATILANLRYSSACFGGVRALAAECSNILICIYIYMYIGDV